MTSDDEIHDALTLSKLSRDIVSNSICSWEKLSSLALFVPPVAFFSAFLNRGTSTSTWVVSSRNPSCNLKWIYQILWDKYESPYRRTNFTQKLRNLNLPSTGFQLLIQDLYSSDPRQAQSGHTDHFQGYQTVKERKKAEKCELVRNGYASILQSSGKSYHHSKVYYPNANCPVPVTSFDTFLVLKRFPRWGSECRWHPMASGQEWTERAWR